MLGQDIIETQQNRMVIEDFRPTEVRRLIAYLYSGKASDFNPTPELLLLVNLLYSSPFGSYLGCPSL